MKEAAQAYTLEMLAVLVRVAMDEGAPPAARVTAANAVLDRGHGKPTTNVDAKVATVDVTKLHLQALLDLSAPAPRPIGAEGGHSVGAL
ncbi:hypothetical protein [Methylobacterium nodulans]|uniref:hypothetical protein n=1 Tax=Methylobacterium nodulans TaxID=114616 RepID=UPI0018DE15D5|nr:hypothetical protein [Methylobacterium nodulans]